MATTPPLSDAVIVALARLVDDSQGDKREPAHSDIEFQIDQAGITAGDPGRAGRAVGKSKRVRGTLSWAISNNINGGEKFVAGLVATVQGYGGFREESSNYCGKEAITNLAAAFSIHGWELTSDGVLQPKLLDSLTGKALTNALRAYADRARRGALDSPLLSGTAKDLLEATASHVLSQKWGASHNTSNFPTLLGQAFTALNFATSNNLPVIGEPVQKRVERSAYDLACSLNQLRNKQGTGHGRPWESSITPSQGRFAIESMGVIAVLMLDALGP
jgi:cytochrome c553